MSNFIISPIYENWVAKESLSDGLVICSPYIKKSALDEILYHFDIKQSSYDKKLTVITSGDPQYFAKGSSDITALRQLSLIPGVKIYLLNNLHMKAYCVDNKELLITSGNCTERGLFSGGNIEGGIATTDKREIAAFNEYCYEMMESSIKLENSSEITSFCDDVEQWLADNGSEINGLLRRESTLYSQSPFPKGNVLMKGNKRVKRTQTNRFVPGTELHLNRQAIVVNSNFDYSHITTEVAYILGGIVLNGFHTVEYNQSNYVFSPVRYNNRPNDREFVTDLNEHRDKVIMLLHSISKDISYLTTRELGDGLGFGGLVGFSVLFKSNLMSDRKNTLDEIFDDIKNSSKEIKISFLRGMFDSKGSPDATLKSIAIDVEDIAMGIKINEIIMMCGMKPFPVNNPREREHKDNVPRKAQVRVRLDEFFSIVGLLSPIRTKKSSEITGREMQDVDDATFVGLKKLRTIGE